MPRRAAEQEETMKMRQCLVWIALAAASVAGTGAWSRASAQELAATHLPVRHVNARLIAWWIDCAHQKEPLELVQSRKNLGASDALFYCQPARQASGGTSGEATSQRVIGLPQGIESMTVDDAKNELIVSGGAEAVAQLRQ